MICIDNKEDCCGCSACESICSKDAISLMPDTEGFLYPKVNSGVCIDCHLCENICPVIRRDQNHNLNLPLKYFALRIKDKIKLSESSSGGAFTAFAQYVLCHNGIVVGATYSDKMLVKHIFVNREEDLWKLRGSKYVQSDLHGVFRSVRDMLKENKLVLFSGTPCQVEGLKLFLRKDYHNLITIDLICHAVVSPRIFKDYICYLRNKFGKDIRWMNMRDKTLVGWSHRFVLKTSFNDGSCAYDDNYIPWGDIFGSHVANRPSCHQCRFTNYSRPGDVTIADFWDDRNLRPEIHSAEGTSVCLVNSEKGLCLLNNIRDYVEMWKITKDEAWQPCLESPTLAHEKRDEFWEVYLKSGFMKAYRKFIYIPIRIRVIWRVKDFIAKIIGYKRNS